jgi:hypothetical protein
LWPRMCTNCASSRIKTFRKLIKLLSIHDSVTTKGLTITFWGIFHHFISIQDMIVVSLNFCLKLFYTLDQQLQQFLSQTIGLMTVPAAAHPELCCDFPENKAERLFEDLTDGIAP